MPILARLSGWWRWYFTVGRIAWRLRGWDDRAVQERFLAEGLIDGAEMPDLSNWSGDSAVRRILTPGGRRAAVATISRDYQFHAREPDPRLRHRRPVSCLAEVDRSLLDDRVRKFVNAPGTLCRIQ